MGEGHPERPERLVAVEAGVADAGLESRLARGEAPAASREQLLRVHDAAYLDALERLAPAHGLVQLDPDTAMNPYTLPAALRAAGAGALGFCFLDNVAVAAAHALERHGLKRVAIVDFDVHHGNGTEDIFRDDPRVLMVSTFQHPFYPYSGIDGRSERMVNIPLAAGSGGREFREAVQTHWLPALQRFAPEMIFFSA